MAEQSLFWLTNGVGDGSSSGYTMAQVTEWQRALFAGLTGADLSGIAPDYQNKLAVSGTSSPVAIATGAALAYGFFYSNTASVNVVVPTPSTSTRIDRIVLQVDWAAQTVRIARVAGTEGGAAPALTQTAGTTWEMSLATVSITTGGVITVTDAREWLNMVGDGMVTAAKLAADVKIGPTVMYIPFLGNNSDVGSGGGEGVSFTQTTYSDSYPQVEITKEHFPSTCTVKLVAFGFSGGGATHNLQLYNVTDAAAVTGSELTVTAGLEQQAKSGDIRANLASGAKRYLIQGKSSSGSCSIQAAYLLVEWA